MAALGFNVYNKVRIPMQPVSEEVGWGKSWIVADRVSYISQSSHFVPWNSSFHLVFISPSFRCSAQKEN